MSSAPVEVQEQVQNESAEQQAPEFNFKEYVKAKNEGKPVPVPEKPAEAKPEEPQEQPKHSSVSRSQRSLQRQLRQTAEELGYYRGLAEAREALLNKATANSGKDAGDTTQDTGEPQRNQFQSDAEYLRAVSKWDKQQETSAADKAKQDEAFRAELKEMDAKTATDIEALFPDWDAVMAESAENEDAPELDWGKNPTLAGLFAHTPNRAAIIYHWAKNPDEMQSMLDLSSSPNKQISAFHRLEGKLETLYTPKQAAQASKSESKTKEDRTHLAEAEKPGEPEATRQVVKPKPSSVVSASGGSSAVPERPAPGSAAWMQARNQGQYGR